MTRVRQSVVSVVIFSHFVSHDAYDCILKEPDICDFDDILMSRSET